MKTPGVSAPLRPVTPIGRRPAQIRTVDACGLGLRVGVWSGEESAATPPLLVFNGIGAGLEMVAPFADELAGRTVIAFDAPGAGESDVPLLPYRMWMLATAVGRMLDELGIDRVDAIGVSWGGAAVQQFAVQHPHRCRRLILAATSPGVLMVPPKMSVLARFMTPRRFNEPGYLHSVAKEIYGGKPLDREVLSGFRRTSRRGYLWQQLALTGWSSLPWLRLVRQPTLVLAGSDDRVVRPANLQILAAMLPDARLAVLDDGHLFILTSAAETAALITAFLDAPTP